jgi:SAM-dependent methyltransferase
MNVFDEMGRYWAEIADQNPTNRQVQFIKNTLKAKGLVLDLACGTGRHAGPLSKEGYEMVGLDISSNLLKIAKNRWSNVKLVMADMRCLPFKPGAFSAAVSMDTSFGYLPSEQDDAQSLKELREALGEGGELIVDVFNRERLILNYGSNRLKEFKLVFLPVLLKFNNRLAGWILCRFFRWREYPTFFLLQKRTLDEGGARLRDVWVVHDKANGETKVFRHVVRLYEFKRLQGLLEQAGFVIKAVYGDYEKQNFSADSDRLIFVAGIKS